MLVWQDSCEVGRFVGIIGWVALLAQTLEVNNFFHLLKVRLPFEINQTLV